MNFGRLIARVAIGGLFVGHGSQKLFGWFGGSGVAGTAETMHKLELRPARHHAMAAGVAETAGGALLALGALTPLAASALTATMITAIRKVHFANGPWNTSGGYEYNLALIVGALALVDSGPGDPSVDRALGIEARGNAWTLAALAAGTAGSLFATEYGRRTAAEEAAAQPNQGATGRFVREGETIEAQRVSPVA